MIIEHFLIPEANETNVYLAACRATREAALIDAGGYTPGVADFVREHGLRVSSVLITHGHYDHTDAIERYLADFGGPCPVRAGARRTGGVAAKEMSDGETFELGTLTVRALRMGGHTEDGVAFHFVREASAEKTSAEETSGEGKEFLPAVSVVFSGDALFAGSVGGAAPGRAHDREIADIRSKIFTLPDETLVFPGHGPATTVGVEKRHNPFFV
ncbi:MBL fold metallo-hydrolase [Candidatus Sumerlaeota bacterium]|nr:MBL fold metallo-hydrolase [Candidatus Sumerlaeota bacterium]